MMLLAQVYTVYSQYLTIYDLNHEVNIFSSRGFLVLLNPTPLSEVIL